MSVLHREFGRERGRWAVSCSCLVRLALWILHSLPLVTGSAWGGSGNGEELAWALPFRRPGPQTHRELEHAARKSTCALQEGSTFSGSEEDVEERAGLISRNL